MCKIVDASKLVKPRENFIKLINNVHEDIRRDYGITFSIVHIGSGKHNLVIKRCDNDSFDLDYQIIIQNNGKVDIEDCKKIKSIFMNSFNKFKSKEFSPCENSTQAITINNKYKKYGYDIIITRLINDCYYIIYNNKNRNNNNNKDYQWQKQSDLGPFNDRINSIKGPKMWNDLRKRYEIKRHKYLNQKNKKSYQILNEAAFETLKQFR